LQTWPTFGGGSGEPPSTRPRAKVACPCFCFNMHSENKEDVLRVRRFGACPGARPSRCFRPGRLLLLASKATAPTAPWATSSRRCPNRRATSPGSAELRRRPAPRPRLLRRPP
jgi:hypothetical protein